MTKTGEAGSGLQYVKDTYGVPVEVGQRVIHGRDHGTVIGGDGARVSVLFDGEKHPAPCHPLSLDYGDGTSPGDRLAQRNARIDIWNDRLSGRITQREYAERWVAAAIPSMSPDGRREETT
jgi:hypothetical protein